MRFIDPRFLFSLFLLITPLGNLLAQGLTLRGKVLDQATNAPVQYATVAVWGRDSVLLTGTTTDDQGQFQLTGLTETAPVVRVQFLGYESATLRPTVPQKQGTVDLQTIFLLASSQNLREVTVTGERAANSVQIDKQVFSARQFQNAANGTGLDLLRRLPALTVTGEGAVALRGSTGLLVLINGKPSNRTPAEVLTQLPANTIESIEVITSPSAKYDAEGRAGILNIITKKDAILGWSGQGSAFFGGADPLRFGGDGSVTYSARDWSAFVGADYRRFDIDGYRVGQVRTLIGDTLTSYPSEGIRNYNEYQYSLRAGGSYTPTARNTLNVSLYAGERFSARQADLRYDELIGTGQNLALFDEGNLRSIRQTFNQNRFVRSGQFQTASTDWTHTFADKGKLTLLGIYEYSVLGGPLTNLETINKSERVVVSERSDERSPLRAWRVQTDYVRPIAKGGKLEAGYQYRSLNHAGQFDFERLNLTTGRYQTDPAFADDMDLQQRIHAGYASVSGTLRKLAYTVGLRAEYTNRTLTHRLGRRPYQFDALNLFPSVQGMWSPADGHKWRLAYSRRIDRPTTRLMAPFQNHRHAETIEVGDPNLRPELANILEASYTRTGKAAFVTLTGYLNRVRDKIFRVNSIYNRTILLRTYTNAGSSTAAGLEVLTEVKPVDFWRIYVSGNVYRFIVRGRANNLSLDQASTNYNWTFSNTLTISKRLSWQSDATYLSRTVTTQGADSELLLANTGFRYMLWNGRGSANLQLLNVFNSNVQTIMTQGVDFYSSTDYRKYDRVVQISLSFALSDAAKRAKTTKTEYGEKDF